MIKNTKITRDETDVQDVVFITIKNNISYGQNYDIGKLLYKKLIRFTGISGDLLDDSFWAYITHIPCGKKYIIRRYFDSVNEEDEESMKIIDKI